MRTQDRHILLFLDNAPCHPPVDSLTNIKLVFLPANTTSILQPLDQGIIQNLKLHYRKLLLRRVLSHINDNIPQKQSLDPQEYACIDEEILITDNLEVDGESRILENLTRKENDDNFSSDEEETIQPPEIH